MLTDKIRVTNEDCMDLMARTPDKYYDLAIVDPPYGINMGKHGRVGGSKPFGNAPKFKHGVGLGIVKPKEYKPFDDSKIPDKHYFEELKRVSKHQIIWGGNYFVEHLTNSPCWIIWDKNKTGFFADGEIAWTSFTSAVKIFKWTWNGMLQQNMSDKEERLHPTQKPVALYKWLLKNYAKPGDKILDTHLGSGSIAIACHYMGFELDACELDPDYYRDACKRFKEQTLQLKAELK